MTGPSDKITITQYPPLPSLCCICNFSSDGKRRFLDFQMSLDVYGAVTICEFCIIPVAHLFDFVSKDSLEVTKLYLEASNQTIVGLKKENEQLNTTLDSIFNLRPDFASSNTRHELLAHKHAEEIANKSESRLETSGGSNTKSDESATVG